MSYLFLALSIISVSTSNIFGGYYTRRTSDKKDASALYSFLQLLIIFLLWGVMFCFNFSFDIKVIPYSLLFAVCFATATIGKMFAFKTGPVMLTGLIVQMSLIAVCIWGLIFWGDKFSAKIGIGLVLVSLSLWLSLYKGKDKSGEKKKISIKWILFCAISFVGNAGCTIVQTTQQMRFDGQHKNMLMFFATFFAMLLGLALYLKSDKTDTKAILKTETPFPVLAGAFNVALNYFVMALTTAVPLLSSSFRFSAIGVGGLIITSLFSLFAFKEKLKWWQWIGVGLGIVATCLLS